MGDKIYLPHSEQFDKMNGYLEMIARGIGSQIYEPTWKGVQNAVRAGVAPELYPVGTQFVVHHETYGDHLYDVVAHDHYKSIHDENAHTMTLMCHDIILDIGFDHDEAFYYAENELPAGTYNFTIDGSLYSEECPSGTYYFELTKAVPKGGCIMVEAINHSHAPTSVIVYSKRTIENYNDFLEKDSIYLGDDGISLGTMSKQLNSWTRVTGGSGNYKESLIRQFLNSSVGEGKWWYPQTKFDVAVMSKVPSSGFLKGMDGDFLSVLGKVEIPCVANIEYESPDSETSKGEKYTVSDLFYLHSFREMRGNHVADAIDDSMRFPYFYNSTKSDFIKYKDGVPSTYWDRTPVGRTSYGVGGNTSDGGTKVLHPDAVFGIAPVCNIV